MNYTYSISYRQKDYVDGQSIVSELKKGYLIISDSKKWLWLKNDQRITIRNGAANDDLISRIYVGNSITIAAYSIQVIKLINSSYDKSDSSNSSSSSSSSSSSANNSSSSTSISATNSSSDANNSNSVNANNSKSVNDCNSATDNANKENVLSSVLSIDTVSATSLLSSSSSSTKTMISKPVTSSSLLSKRKASNDLERSSTSKDTKNKTHHDSTNITNNSNQYEQLDYNLKSEVELDQSLILQMRPHQIEGAMFILDLLLGKKQVNNDEDKDLNLDLSVMSGAILADEMGTGKTLTSLSVLWSLCRHGRCKGIIVCPKSLLGNWEAEIKKWLPSSLARTALYVRGTGAGQNGPDATVNRFITTHASVHPVLVINYEMFRSFSDALNTVTSLEVLICDEGHRLKNAYGNKTSLALGNSIATKRLVLTGTPIQNNLEELYAVVQFAAPGFLGMLSEFKSKYVDVISKCRESNCSDIQRKKGLEAATKLKRLLSYILLRRTQDSVLGSILPPRTDYTIQCYLQKEQKELYINESKKILDNLLNDEQSRQINNTDKNKSPMNGVLSQLLKLRLICNNSSNDSNSDNSISSKLSVLEKMLLSVKSIGSEKVVVVSNFMSTLDQIFSIGKSHKWSMLRLDGSVQPEKRMKIVQHFNNPTSEFFLMLLSAKAGGVGLNLTGASRLILFEPDWNPAIDLQAMGRIWRDGQTKPVFIYRLICNGTIEECILNRQREKNELSFVIKESHDLDDNSNSDDSDMISQYMANVDVKSLIIPSGFEGLNEGLNTSNINDMEASDNILLTMKNSNVINSIHNINKTTTTK